MAALVQDLEIWFDGEDEPLRLRADQRDMAAFELEYKIGTSAGMEQMPMVFFRFLGWHAARRLGKIPTETKRDEWLSNIITIEPPDDDEGLTPVGPTNPAQ